MILITGAAGKTGQAVIRALRARTRAIRALVHKEQQIEAIKALGAQEVVVGDMGSQVLVEKAMQGVSAVYHICPNVHREEVRFGEIAIRAAQRADVERFVYHSVLHPQIEAMPHHWLKMRVEALLFESGLAYTILQPAPYMQNILPYWKAILTEKTYAVPYATTARLSSVDLRDVAEVAAMVLTEPDHAGATYELCGPDRLSTREVADILSRLLGFRVQAQALSVDAWATDARKQGLSAPKVDMLTRMFRYYDRFGLVGNDRVLTCLLDQPPNSFASFLESIVPGAERG